MGYIPDEYLPFLRGTDGGLRLALFFKIGNTEPNVLRLWLGTWRVKTTEAWVGTGITAVDSLGEIYKGAGRVIDFPDLEVSTNATAPRIQMSLSGVDAANIALLETDWPDVTGMPVWYGFSTLDDRFQPEFPIQRLWSGFADFVTEERNPAPTPDKPWEWRVGISMGSGDGRRSKPLQTAFTDAQHKLLYPTDNFFNRIVRYVQGLRFSWPTS